MMVSAEKGEPEGRAIGDRNKRSRGASPNGHYSDFSDEEREGGSSRWLVLFNLSDSYFISTDWHIRWFLMQLSTMVADSVHSVQCFLFLTDGGMRVGRDYQAQIPLLTPLTGITFFCFFFHIVSTEQFFK